MKDNTYMRIKINDIMLKPFKSTFIIFIYKNAIYLCVSELWNYTIVKQDYDFLVDLLFIGT